jgi:hypothetical protein
MNDFATLAAQINETHNQIVTGLRTTLDHARRAGELLSQVRAGCTKKGEFGRFLKTLSFSRRTAYSYLSIFEQWETVQRVAQDGFDGLGLKAVLKKLARPKSDSQAEHDQAGPVEVVPSDPLIATARKYGIKAKREALVSFLSEFGVSLDRQAA